MNNFAVVAATFHAVNGEDVQECRFGFKPNQTWEGNAGMDEYCDRSCNKDSIYFLQDHCDYYCIPCGNQPDPTTSDPGPTSNPDPDCWERKPEWDHIGDWC